MILLAAEAASSGDSSIVPIIIAVLSSTVLTAIVTALSSRRQRSSEVTHTDVETLSEIIKNLREDVGDLRKRVENLEAEKAALTLRNAEILAEHMAEKQVREHRIWELEAEVSKLSSENVLLEGKVEHLQQQVTALQNTATTYHPNPPTP